MVRFYQLVAMLFIGIFHSGAISAFDWKTIDLPNDSRLSIVAENMRQNGHLIHIAEFHSTSTVVDVIAFYTQAWGDCVLHVQNAEIEKNLQNATDHWRPESGQTPPCLVEQAAGRLLISRLDSNFNHVVDLPVDTHVQALGTYSILKLGGGKFKEPSYAGIKGMTLQSMSSSEDSGQGRSDLGVLMSRYDIAETTDVLDRFFQRNNWKLEMQNKEPQASVHTFRKPNGSEAILIVVRGDNGGSMAIVNEIQKK